MHVQLCDYFCYFQHQRFITEARDGEPEVRVHTKSTQPVFNSAKSAGDLDWRLADPESWKLSHLGLELLSDAFCQLWHLWRHDRQCPLEAAQPGAGGCRPKGQLRNSSKHNDTNKFIL